MRWFNRTVLILLLIAGASSVFGQCYTGLRTEGVADFRQKQYKQAISKFFAARQCPDKPPGDDLDVLIKSALNAWEEDLRQAVERANQERDKALKATELAQTQTQRALEQKEAAEHLARASNNAALAIRLMRTDPTLAVRIADFNYRRYPWHEAAAVAMRETLNSGVPLYKKRMKANKYTTSVAYRF